MLADISNYASLSQLASTDKLFYHYHRLISYYSIFERITQQTLLASPNRATIYHQFHHFYSSRLDINKLIDNTPQMNIFFKQFPTKKLFAEYFSVKLYSRKKTEYYRHLSFKMRASMADQRKQDYIHRLSVEICEAVDKGWYLVFNTLTASDANYNKSFQLGTSIIRDYIRSITNYMASEGYGSVRKAPHASIFHRYFCCIERGGKTNRLHYHVLHFFKFLPAKWQYDPNTGLQIPLNREINALKDKRFWSYGHCVPIAVRYSVKDSWGQLGWRYPYAFDGEAYNAIKQVSPLSIAYYMGKYVTKLYTESYFNKGNHKWRMKMTRQFGMTMIHSLLTHEQTHKLSLMGQILPYLRQTTQQKFPLPSKKLMKYTALKLSMTQMNTSAKQTLILTVQSQSPLFSFSTPEIALNTTRIQNMCQKVIFNPTILEKYPYLAERGFNHAHETYSKIAEIHRQHSNDLIYADFDTFQHVESVCHPFYRADVIVNGYYETSN